MSSRASTVLSPSTSTSPAARRAPRRSSHGLTQLQEKIRAERVSGPQAARHLQPDAASEFPVPDYGAHDLQPPSNPALFTAPVLPRKA